MRNAPLLRACSHHSETNAISFIDERALSYRALGYSKTNKIPALVCTSGTALANFLPAVIEAYRSNQPMVVISADRPIDLVKTDANQTIDQKSVINNFVCDSLFLGLSSSALFLASVYFLLLAPSEPARKMQKPIAKKVKKVQPKIKKAKDVTKKLLKEKPTKTAKKIDKKPIKIKKRKVISRSSESIKKAAFFKKKKLKGQTDLREVEVPPEAIFDDNTDPVELDPIRQRISKDIIDPELEAYDEETPINELEDISRQIAPLDDFEDDPYREPAGDEEYYEDEPFYE